jgi:NodT family efflux transporter outer membrane factor (OMF) lipoprotein
MGVKLILVLAIGACSLTPKAVPPQLIPKVEGLQTFKYGTPSDTAPARRIAWWRDIGGDELDALVSELLASSFRLTEARAQALQFAERANQTRGARLPSINGSSDSSYARSQSFTGDPDWMEGYGLGVSATFNTDIFGALRATDRSTRLNAAAADISYQAAVQQEIAILATNWVAAVTLKRRLALARTIAESFQSTYDLSDKRYRAGSSSASATSVQIAKQNLDAALVDIPNLEAQLTTQLLVIDEQLACLPGKTAQAFEGTWSPYAKILPPLGMPGALLNARPDVAAADLRFQAALEDVGAARANLFPALTLTGALTFQNADLGEVFSWDQHLATLAASLTQPIFQGGRLRAEVRLQKAEAEELAAAYGRTALAALVDVESALVEIAGLTEQVSRLKSNVATAEKSNQITDNRYRQGLDTILSLLETQRSLNAARENLILTEQALINARITLFLSLGGVWFDEAATSEAGDEPNGGR